MRRLIRTTSRAAAAILLAVVALWVASEAVISIAARGRTYDLVDRVPARKAALVLGTSKFVAGGRPNLHYLYRMDAAAELFKAGKARFVIVSGNGSEPHYNEPKMMRADLIARGVPPARIYCDYAGLRTLDSVVRAGEVFGAGDCIVVSQPSHAERAIFIGRMRGQDVIGFNARNVPASTDPRTAIRERLARILALLDVTVLRKQPKFLGEKVELGSSQPAPNHDPS